MDSHGLSSFGWPCRVSSAQYLGDIGYVRPGVTNDSHDTTAYDYSICASVSDHFEVLTVVNPETHCKGDRCIRSDKETSSGSDVFMDFLALDPVVPI